MSDDEEAPTSNVFVRALRAVTPNVLRRRFALKFAVVLLVMAASVGVIGIAATQGLTNQVQDNVANEYENLAAQEADLIANELDRHKLTTQLFSTNPEWGANRTEDLRRDLRIERSDLDAVSDILIIDRRATTGERYVAAGAGTEADQAVTQADRGWVSDLSFRRTSETRVSGVYQVDGEHVVGIVSPVTVSQQRLLLVEVSVADIAATLRGAERAEGGFTEVVNGSGAVQMSERSSGLLAPYATNERTLAPLENAKQLRLDGAQRAGAISDMAASTAVIDEPYIVGYAPVEGVDWYVLSHAPKSSVFGLVQTVSNWGTIATVAGVLLIALVGATLGVSTSRSINRLRDRAEAMESGNLDVTIHSNRIDDIGRLYDSFENMRDALTRQIQEAEQAQKEAEVSRAEAMELSNYLQDKAEEYSAIMQRCSKGDLTQRMEPDGENEAMDRIAEDFNGMIDELEKTTGQLKRFAEEVNDAGDVVQQSAESVRDASEQVADSVQKISDDAHEEMDRLDTLSETMDETIQQLETVADDNDIDVTAQLAALRDVAETVNDIAELTEQTMAEAETVAGAAEEQAAELSEVSQQAEDLTRYARPLGDVLGSFETEAEHEFYFPTGPGSPSTEEEP
ncbi:HAMP domain-containing protein [Halorhabdus sp. CBA1104]|uniref:PDC sensor domain-containing protein n=1 Tax=unclassified Halorhabdus TaxID=2621901 RepID=UPI0012B37A47|nr:MULTISPECIES: HAMP domain-containing protein [unclassified Halorhabdus]QGN06224.1 HAMP domain-containing protein [Halorhabdus sp. CBA1104]